MAKVLITGGSGLVGSRLTQMLQAQQYEVVHLGREARTSPVKTYAWDISESKLDPAVFEGIDHVVHLAGAGVADKSWSLSRKQEILASRVEGTKLLLKAMEWPAKKPRTLISASAIGYYGDAGKTLCMEDSPLGQGFLAEVCDAWEKAAVRASDYTRLCTVRIGIVLSTNGGALPKMMLPFKFYAGGVLGSGKQMMSWIHIDDLCRMIIHLIENEACQGTYNAVAPLPVEQYTFMKALGRAMHRPLWMWVPTFALRLTLGEMADTVLHSQFVSNDKIQETGFRFNYETVYKALGHLVKGD
jgi:uncharacterized protein (TIGR01777 family)